MQTEIPVYSGDLHCHAVGCYSINRALKQAVRNCERSLGYAQRVQQAENSARAASLNPLWQKTIFNQFHDIMPGSCSPEAAGQAMDELGGVLNEFQFNAS